MTDPEVIAQVTAVFVHYSSLQIDTPWIAYSPRFGLEQCSFLSDTMLLIPQRNCMFIGLCEWHWLCDCSTVAFFFVPIEEIQIGFTSYSHLLPL